MSTNTSDIQSAVEESFQRVQSMDVSDLQQEQKKNTAEDGAVTTPHNSGIIRAYDLRSPNTVRALQIAADATKTPEEHRAFWAAKNGLDISPSTKKVANTGAPSTPTRSKREKIAGKIKSVFSK